VYALRPATALRGRCTPHIALGYNRRLC